MQLLSGGALQGGTIYVVVAPAGYGKTTLLSQYRNLCEVQCWSTAWLGLEDEDNNEVSFYTYLSAAFERLAGKPYNDPPGQLQEGGDGSERHLVAALVAATAESEGNHALFLDDYHLIQEPQIHDTLHYLLKHLPENLALFIGSRTPLPIPIAKLRASNRLVEMGLADLRFDRAEAEQLLISTNHLELETEDLDKLYRHSDGWAAVLQLAALSLKGASDTHAVVERISGSHGSIADFFSEEIMTLMSQEMAEFLTRTAIVERLSAPLCEAIIGEGRSGEDLLNHIELRPLLQELDDQADWFRLHPLFHSFLFKQLEISFPREKPELHRRASLWFEEQGLVAEAIQHAISAGEEERAQELLEEHGILLLSQGYLPLFFGLVRRLPEGLLHGSHEILVQMAWLEVLNNRIPQAGRILDELKQGIATRQDDEKPLTVEIKAIEGAMHFFTENLPAVETVVAKWLPQAPPEPLHIVATFRIMQAWIYFNQQHYDETLQQCRWVLNLPEVADIAYSQANAALFQALVAFARAQLEIGAVTLATEIERFRERVGSKSQVIALMESVLAAFYYQLGDLEKAQGLFERGLEAHRALACVDFMIVVLRNRIRQLHATGEYNRALALLDDAQQMADSRNWARLHACVLHEKVRLLIALGEQQQAVAFFNAWRQTHESLLKDETWSEQVEEWFSMAAARVSIAQGSAADVINGLSARWESLSGQGRILRSLELAVLLASAHAESGNADAAKEVLENALALDRNNCVIQLYRDEGAGVLHLLAQLQENLEAVDGNSAHMLLRQQLQRILAGEQQSEFVAGAAALPNAGYNEMVEQLTKRELATLELLVEGLSNKEIANRQYVSVNTVKTHLQSAYSKLGVSRRTQAVRRMKEMGFFS
jgi:ATP/maltotriose-dependent transcriptional regulator MalT